MCFELNIKIKTMWQQFICPFVTQKVQNLQTKQIFPRTCHHCLEIRQNWIQLISFNHCSRQSIVIFYFVWLLLLVNYFWLVKFYHNWKQFRAKIIEAFGNSMKCACIADLHFRLLDFSQIRCLLRSMRVIKFSSWNNM